MKLTSARKRASSLIEQDKGSSKGISPILEIPKKSKKIKEYTLPKIKARASEEKKKHLMNQLKNQNKR